MARHWLILSYFSGIDGMACAQHIDDRLPLLQARGIIPILLTGVCGKARVDVPTVQAPSVAPSGVRFELRHLRRRIFTLKFAAPILNLLLLPFYVLEKLLIDLNSQWSWFPLAIVRGRQLCRKFRPEIIYSTGGPASAHLAAAVIARRFGIPWIAEFQDPLVHEDWRRSRRALWVYAWLERLICARADAIIFVTEGARERADLRTGLHGRGWTLYPGADPAGMPQDIYEKGEFCRFAHFGSFGGSRNPKVFLEALRQLIAERPEMASVIRLDLFGSCDRLSRFIIADFPAPEMICDCGRVPRLQALSAMKRSDVLLLIQNTEKYSAETIPSKVYEYFLAGRPILALVHDNPELGEMMTRKGHIAVEANLAEEVREGIAALADRWKAEDFESIIGGGFLVEEAVMRLVRIGEAVAARGRPTGGVGAAGPGEW
jgi:hypothetical protein